MKTSKLYEASIAIKMDADETHGARFRTLIAGVKAALDQNACFKGDVALALKWLTEAQQILNTVPDGLVRMR